MAIQPSWVKDLAAMKANGSRISASCSKCGYHKKQIDIDALIAAKGEAYSLWDVRPQCRKTEADGRPCRGKVIFHYCSGVDQGPMFPLVSR